MTDEQIIQALECHTITMKCGECPYDNAFIGDGDVEINVIVNNNCFKGLGRDAINLIKKQREEIDRLEAEVDTYVTLAKDMHNKAIKMFVEKLKENAGSSVAVNNGQEIYETKCYNIMAYKLDNLVKEMGCGE